MDKKSKILFLIIGLLIVASVAVTYWRIMVKKDYIIEAQTDCDPYTDKCFIWECDPESDVEGEACTGDPDTDTWYFQVVKRNASQIPLCDPNTDENCEALVCGENEPDCEYVFCTEENMEAQYATACNDPEQYTLENPIDEEECDPEVDEDCEAAEECDPEIDENCEAAEECDPEVDEDCEPAEDLPADEAEESGIEEDTVGAFPIE